MSDPILPDNDIDVQLAKKLGMLLEDKASVSEAAGDPLVEMLSQLKISSQSSKQDFYPDSAASTRMWNEIYAATKPEQKSTRGPSAKIFTLNPAVYRIALAACLLAAVAISWMLFLRGPAPVLLAQAGQSIEQVTLQDGSTVSLRPNSKLYSVSAGETEERYQLDGEGFFDVVHNTQRTFSVVSGDAQISVLGTTFNVNAWKEEVTVYLQEGSIELKNQQSGQAVVLSPGQSGTVNKDQVTLHGQPANPGTHLDWMEDEITFFGTPLYEVIDEIEFHFDVAIEIPQNRINESISGTIVLEDVSYVLSNLSFVMEGGSFVQTGEHSYRFEAN